MHFEELLDLGYDYGADGGQAWATVITPFPNGSSVRNSDRENAIGEWQLGNRRVGIADYEYLKDFHHAMRGMLHTFNYKDWNDYNVAQEAVANDGGATTQLTKTYGLSINAWVRAITKIRTGSSFLLELDSGGGFVEQVDTTDYALDATTGIVTWVTPPNTADAIRWTGEFYVPVRFNVDVLDAQFLAIEEDGEVVKRVYQLGPLSVVEDPEA